MIIMALPTLAQEEWERNDPRSMESMVFDVVGNKEITLPPAARLFEPIPPQSYQRSNPSLEYSFESFFYPAEAIALRLRPRPLASVPEEKLYGNYLRAGFGNFATPFLDFYSTNKRQKEFSYGMKLNYMNSFRGPVDEANSAQGRFNTGIFGSVYGDKITLSGEAGYIRENLHFYGYQDGTGIEPDDILQVFNRLDLKGSFKNTSAEDDFQINGKLGLKNVSNNFDAKETEIYADLQSTLEVLAEARTITDLSFSSISRDDPQFSGENRVFVSARGGLEYQLDRLRIHAILRADYLPDTLAGEKGLHLYPIAGILYQPIDNVEIKFGTSGGVQKQTYNMFSSQNLYLQEGQYVAGTILQSGLYANARISLGNYFNLSGGIEISSYKNSFYFNNDPLDQSRFEVLYDTGVVRLVNPTVTLLFNKDEKYRTSLSLDLFNYSMDVLPEAWHKPAYVLGSNSNINIVEKFRITLDAYLMGGIKAQEGVQTVELDAITDLNLGIEYFTGSRMSVFLQGKNLTGSNYQLLNNYPVRGIQVLGGMSYKF